MKGTYKIIWAFVFALYCLIPFQGPAKEKCFEHNIQLQLSDADGFPVPGTEFWVKLNIIKEGHKVTIQLPTINFQTGPQANYPLEQPPIPPGGYLYTSAGFLPEHLRPHDIVCRSWLAASNNGASLPFSFAQDPSTLPTPPVGYILQVTNAGALVIQCAGTFDNAIPPGPQILLPTDISYIVKPKVKLKKNTKISTGATNVTQFTGDAALDYFKDTHVNDAFDGVAAWAWSDNSTVADKTNGTMNLMVAIGKKGKDGKLKVRKRVQLTDLPPEVMVWETAVAINRTNKNNIVVSYGILDFVNGTYPTYRAVSFDGGKTWTENGPTNIQPPSGDGLWDARGVASDMYGNIWYNASDYNNGAITPYFMASTDGGVTFQLVYIGSAPTAPDFYDFPQYCFGGDGQGNYGLHFVVDYFDIDTFDIIPAVGFIPITGLGQFGTPSFAQLFSLLNVNAVAGITASMDGRVWTFGLHNAGPTGNYILPSGMIFKSPGPLDLNYAGLWDYAVINAAGLSYGAQNTISAPYDVGYINNSSQSNFFDDKRQALYAIVAAQNPDYSQNMRLYFSISRDNGQTWSNEIDISNTDFANRGFQSMALDAVKGDLYFGWYDGRNDPTYQSVEYYGTVIPAKQLDKLVNKIPLSNPLFSLPSAATPLGAPLEGVKLNAKTKKALQKRFEHRFRKRHRKKTAV